jgi:transposase
VELTEEQFLEIEPFLPTPCGKVTHDTRTVLNGILYVLENGCKWRSLPKIYGIWHTVYARMNRLAKNGILQKIFQHFARKQINVARPVHVSLDTTSIKVSPDATGAFKKKAPRP